MSTPETPEEWWKLLDGQWANIIDIFQRCGAPLDSEAWNDASGELVFHDRTLLGTLEHTKDERDHETMHNMLELCWSAAPDKPYIHQWPGWGHLCDLCSEFWVFEEEPEGAA